MKGKEENNNRNKIEEQKNEDEEEELDMKEFVKDIQGMHQRVNLETNMIHEQDQKLVGVNDKLDDYKDKNYQKDLESLLHRAKEIKKNLLLDEEIGVTFFYDTIFKKEGINIYGTNLKNKMYFPIKQLLLEPNKNNGLSFDMIYSRWLLTLFANYLEINRLDFPWS